MANWIDCTLDVLATSPQEINEIAKALQSPSRELLATAAEARPPDEEEIAWLRQALTFRVVKYLGYVHESVNKARRFQNSFKAPFQGLVDEHLCQVSIAFPSSIFLSEYRDMQASYAWKEVMRRGIVEYATGDWNQPAQAIDWVLLDIFAPFCAEYDNGQPFGSMWNKWLADMVTAIDRLTNPSPSMSGVCGQDLAQREIEDLIERKLNQGGCGQKAHADPLPTPNQD